MEFDLIGDTGDSVGSISNSNFFGRQVKSREYYSLPTLYFMFHLSMFVAFVVMGVVHVVFGGLFKFNDVFFGKINID